MLRLHNTVLINWSSAVVMRQEIITNKHNQKSLRYSDTRGCRINFCLLSSQYWNHCFLFFFIILTRHISDVITHNICNPVTMMNAVTAETYRFLWYFSRVYCSPGAAKSLQFCWVKINVTFVLAALAHYYWSLSNFKHLFGFQSFTLWSHLANINMLTGPLCSC